MSIIKTIKSSDNIRSERSNFITMPCLNIEADETVIKTLDMRLPFDKFVPMYIVDDYMKEIVEKMDIIRMRYLNGEEIIQKAKQRATETSMRFIDALEYEERRYLERE